VINKSVDRVEVPIKQLYESMRKIREVEELIANKYAEELFRCPVHLSIGQEAISSGLSVSLSQTDKVVSTHRSHAHYIAKGGNLFRFFSEIMGRTGGCCAGRGGSMHIFDHTVGFLGSIPIVGSSLPIASGIALAEKQTESGNVVVAFVGDAVVETGQFHEALNFISLWNLPILIAIEDNGYSTYADKSVRQTESLNLESIANGFGIPFTSVNGDEVLEVYSSARELLDSARNYKPQIMKFDTFRLYEHCGPNIDDDLGYRNISEVAKYSTRDPIVRFKQLQVFKEKNLILDEIDSRIQSEVFEAFQKALNSPHAQNTEEFQHE
jgi:pyruvate dehydrogenase E1 component alpha subunit